MYKRAQGRRFVSFGRNLTLISYSNNWNIGGRATPPCTRQISDRVPSIVVVCGASPSIWCLCTSAFRSSLVARGMLRQASVDVWISATGAKRATDCRHSESLVAAVQTWLPLRWAVHPTSPITRPL
jgi:hypothetical protein